ncbi:MAG: hypothetical protein LQ341_006234, partial [Variospora aurantia]
MTSTKKRKSAPSEKDRAGKKQKLSESARNTPVARKEEPAFPRGGASVLTPLEQKQIQIQAKNDVLFEQSTGKKAPQNEYENDENDSDLLNKPDDTALKLKRRPRTKSKPGHAAQTSGGKRVRVEGLSYKRLVPGSLVLGQVAQINQYDVALSLPNNLTGYVPITSVSDQLSKKVERLAEQEVEDDYTELGDDDSHITGVHLNTYFAVGQYLRAFVVATEKDASNGTKGKRHIELSINPRQANSGLQPSDIIDDTMIQASVRSVEDHGLVMELGMGEDTVRGFMSSRELGPNVDLPQIREGAVYLCLVTGLSSNGNVVKLSADTLKAGNLKKGHFLTNAPNID